MKIQRSVDYYQQLPKQTRMLLGTCLCGLGAGAATVAFQLGINWLYRLGLDGLSRQPMPLFLWGSLAIISLTSLLSGWLLHVYCPGAAGSGIPQLKLAFWKDFGAVPWRVAWIKFIAGILSIGGGSSLGREGPSVQLAGAVSSSMAGLLGEPKQNRRTAAAAGAASGLAAAFNTPLAATTFVLEEIIGDLNSRWLGGVLLASVLGALVVHGIIGKQPSFTLIGADAPSWKGYLLTPVVAALASMVGVCFQRAALGLRGWVKRKPRSSAWLMPLSGALITWGLGVTVFYWTGHLGVFSLGYDDLSSALAGHVGWKLALLLLVAKFAATFTCYGFGGCGGIFSPSLFFGGMTGALVAGIVNLEFPLAAPDFLTLSVVGMSACLGAVVWAPVTGILIVFEMTHEFTLVPALMLAALVSQSISRKMNQVNFYEALLLQDGHRIEHVRPPRDLWSWQQLSVAAIANFNPVILHDLSPRTIQEILQWHPYQRFPVMQDNRLSGLLTRQEGELALRENRPPQLESPVICRRDQTIRDIQRLLIESSTQCLVVTEDNNNQFLGIVTLHDLLRAEMAKAATRED